MQFLVLYINQTYIISREQDCESVPQIEGTSDERGTKRLKTHGVKDIFLLFFHRLFIYFSDNR